MSLITFSVVIISSKSNTFFLLFPCRFHFGFLALCECRSCFRRPFSLPYLDNNIFDYFSGMEFNKLCLYVCRSLHPSPSVFSLLVVPTCYLPILLNLHTRTTYSIQFNTRVMWALHCIQPIHRTQKYSNILLSVLVVQRCNTPLPNAFHLLFYM